MTVAGSDSGGGAGIEADLKTFAALGVFGACAVTAVTAQNTRGVYEVHPIPPSTVERQIEAVLADVPVQAAKTGMLHSAETMRVVAEAISQHRLRAVVDPVLRAGTGAPLVREGDEKALVETVIPVALVVTPNRQEAEIITGLRIKNAEDLRKAAKSIARLGPEAVVVKGGHMGGETVVDLLYHRGRFRTFKKPRVDVEPHGAGCAFSAAVAAYLALGRGVAEAVAGAEDFVRDAVAFHLEVGRGRAPVNPMAHLYREAERFRVLEDVSAAARTIEEHPEFLPHVAEVGMQIAMALPYASTVGDVAAVEGRIVRFRGAARAAGPVGFGASSHMARVILTAAGHDPAVRAALNLRYDPELVEALEKTGFKVSGFDRRLEPRGVKAAEGGTLAWGVEEAIRAAERVPDAVYDLGEVGKEPMIRVLGASATNAVEKALTAIKALRGGATAPEAAERRVKPVS